MCPQCGDAAAVRTQGGGTHGMYRYRCEDCSIRWQMKPPHRRTDSRERPQMKIMKDKPKCMLCGLALKKCECMSLMQVNGVLSAGDLAAKN